MASPLGATEEPEQDKPVQQTDPANESAAATSASAHDDIPSLWLTGLLCLALPTLRLVNG